MTIYIKPRRKPDNRTTFQATINTSSLCPYDPQLWFRPVYTTGKYREMDESGVYDQN